MSEVSRVCDGNGVGVSGAFDAQTRLSLGSRLAFAIVGKVRIGAFDITVPEGVRRRFEGDRPGPLGEIRIHRPRVASRLALGGNVGLAESYIDGDWDSPHLARLLTVGALNSDCLGDMLDGSTIYRTLNRILHWRNRNSRRGSRRNIAAHYDLGNRFYAEWLDPGMTYSAGIYDDGIRTLEAAQDRKYDALADRLELTPGDRVLELGCGWGGFAERVAKTRGVHVTGITISREQHDFAKARIQREGLNEKVDIRLVDYRDVVGRYDKLASIEMFEAVGEAYWPGFFEVMRDRLKPDGLAAMQVITIADRYFASYRRRPDFIQRYVFPGGMLPSPEVLGRVAEASRMRVVESAGYGLSYAATLAEWNRRFQAGWERIRPMGFDQRFKRTWDYYLAYCEAGFRAGTIDVRQATFKPV